MSEEDLSSPGSSAADAGSSFSGKETVAAAISVYVCSIANCHFQSEDLAEIHAHRDDGVHAQHEIKGMDLDEAGFVGFVPDDGGFIEVYEVGNPANTPPKRLRRSISQDVSLSAEEEEEEEEDETDDDDDDDTYLPGARKSNRKRKSVLFFHCPICDFKDPTREHVARHFMSELQDHLNKLTVKKLKCPNCTYMGEKQINLVLHIALVHSLLDDLLQDEDLVRKKREEVMSKPKKVQIGDHCPVCEQALIKRNSRSHVIWHFMDELMVAVESYSDQGNCNLCGYQNPKADKMAKHMALGHSKLDEFLQDEELVQQKKAVKKPQKLALGSTCPICDMKFKKNRSNREHVAWHFVTELRDVVKKFDNRRYCPLCHYTSDKVDPMAMHMGLGHFMMDQMMLDEAVVSSKREKALAKPRKIPLGPCCPICDLQFNKQQQNRDHVSWHFVDELREVVSSFPNPRKCILCSYTTSKIEYMVKHVALGHSRLDVYLQDEKLVAIKRGKELLKAANLPERFQLGPLCPICDLRSPAREHVVRHFMDELIDHVELKMPDQFVCSDCGFRGEKIENLAKHVGLFHRMLDSFLHDDALTQRKRDEYQSIISGQNSNVSCQVCFRTMIRYRLRDHCQSHFLQEIASVVSTFPKADVCQLCKDMGIESGRKKKYDNKKALMRHVGLAHHMLETFLADPDLLRRKQEEAKLDIVVKKEAEEGAMQEGQEVKLDEEEAVGDKDVMEKEAKLDSNVKEEEEAKMEGKEEKEEEEVDAKGDMEKDEEPKLDNDVKEEEEAKRDEEVKVEEQGSVETAGEEEKSAAVAAPTPSVLKRTRSVVDEGDQVVPDFP